MRETIGCAVTLLVVLIIVAVSALALGAWATTDNAFMIGGVYPYDASFGDIPTPPRINSSNEWGHAFYAFHPQGTNISMADGSIQFLAEDTPLRLLCTLVTRAGGETAAAP